MKPVAMLLLALIFTLPSAAMADPIDIGSRLEPMVDVFLVEQTNGASLRLHEPVMRDVAITLDAPWEGNTSCYFTVFEDDGLFRMYYRGSDFVEGEHKGQRVCYAESTDGITFTKPELNLFEWDGSKANNIVWDGEGNHNFAPFKDPNPDAASEAKYKAVGSREKDNHLVPFQSPDGIHWTQVQEEPIISVGAFDSQNIVFYDIWRRQYVEFHRGFNDGVRAIMTATSPDFVTTWPEPQWLQYGEDTPPEHLYTNAITTLPGAPHIFAGFPKRFLPSRDLKVHEHPGVSDAVFMTSRDGLNWNRWREALVRPGLQKSRWVNRNNMTAWGILTTKAFLPDTPDEWSIYTTEGYYVGPCHLRRHTVRQMGFVSMNAPATGGEFTTKPLVFADDPEAFGQEVSPPLFVSGETPVCGSKALVFKEPFRLELPDTQNLGDAFTLAVAVRNVPGGHRRLFSAYNGGAVDTTQGELWFDINASGAVGNENVGVRFACDGVMVQGETGNWAGDTGVHTLVAVYDRGEMRLYFDGAEVAAGGAPGKGAISLIHGNLIFGEDYPPTALNNEPFLGAADDVLVLRRALTAGEVATLSESGAAKFLEGTDAAGLLYTFEADAGADIADALAGDGAQNAVLPAVPGRPETELVLNCATSAAGTIRCELQNEAGEPLPGYALEDCDPVFGDSLEMPVSWRGGSDLKALTGTPVRVRFVLEDADLYALRFR